MDEQARRRVSKGFGSVRDPEVSEDRNVQSDMAKDCEASRHTLLNLQERGS